MSDGFRLRESWNNALNDAETRFKQLLSASSSEWKRISSSADSSVTRKGKARLSLLPELSDVIVHRHSSKSGDDIYRLILDIPADEELVTLEPWRAVLTTPELRQEWDPAVIDAHLVEMFSQDTRIYKTNFTLGWPASPRDAVTISRTIHDATTVIDISTSLPRSSDEPAYLRPSPPYVRSNVSLLAWCIQHIKSSQPPSESKRKLSLGGRIRVTCFWQHDLRAIWNIGSSSSVVQQLSTMMIGLLKTVTKRATRIPKLVGYGNGVTIEKIRFQIDREALTIEYSVIPEDNSHADHSSGSEGLQAIRDQRRLTRAIECVLPGVEGWDVQLTTKASSEEVEKLPWTAHAMRSTSYLLSLNPPLDQVVLRLAHAPLIDDHSVLKVKLVIEISGPSSGLRLNGVPQNIKIFEEQRDPSSYVAAQSVMPDVGSATDISVVSSSSSMPGSSATSLASSSSAPPLIPVAVERSTGAEKTILSRVKRNYIYFSSLLQEPEAKWKRTTEARGVTITQLDSIDPTLVVYRAEATFVGVGLWDLYGAVVSPGARNFWDKQHEDAILLEGVNELTELWHIKTKPAWPVNGRDSVVLKTVYKSPTTIHVFSFSADDPHLFPHIPAVDPNVIRTQVDLQGWAIEALSPNTTLLTLLEQSDPKGWTNKTSIPTQMINALAGIGEFAIKFGGPPIVTRLTGAKVNDLRYDHERLNFRLEYESSVSRKILGSSPTDNSSISTTSDNDSNTPVSPVIECEIRCDMDTWGQSLDIVVDPPPQSISCLRRHRLSDEGGGLWMTITHDAVFVDDERLQVIVRRGPGREKGVVMLNGAKTNVDVEELPEHEIKNLVRRKRVKPPRIPLDQPPVVGVIRKRKAEWDADALDSPASESVSNLPGASSSLPKVSSPLARFFTYAVNQATATTQQTIAAISPSAAIANDASLSPSKLPMQYALDVLAWTQNYQCSPTPQAGWAMVGDKDLSIRRKLVAEISPVIPVHKGEKIIEGISAEELATIITEPDCRMKWDDRFDSATVFESYGNGCNTSFIVLKGGFPFRDRGFYMASVVARAQGSSSISRRNTDGGATGGGSGDTNSRSRNAIFCVSASFSPDSVNHFSATKYNQYGLPIGRVYIDAWILETLDPYTKENYAVPSSKCTRLVALDYAGSLPGAVNSLINATIPRAILNVESYVKNISSLPITRLPAAGFVLADKKDEDVEVEAYAKFGWRLRKRDDYKTLLRTKYESLSRIYTSLILVNHPGEVYSEKSSAGNKISKSNGSLSPARQSTSQQQVTPRASRVGLNTLHELSSSDSSPITIQDVISASSSSSVYNSSTRLSSPTMTSFLDMATMSPMSPMPNSSTINSLDNNMNNLNLATQAMPGQRERTVSVSSSGFRGRSSSAFTLKGEVRHTMDLLVGEIVIDSKLYPKGYMVTIKSQTRKLMVKGQKVFKAGARGQSKSRSRENGSTSARSSTHLNAAPICLDSLFSSSHLHSSGLTNNTTKTSISSSSTVPTSNSISDSGVESFEHQLPLSYDFHTIPLSPLHSSGSGMNADSTYTYDYESESPTRHLLRMTLPTAQYFVSTIQDPLTGETQVAPPKPGWLLEMEEGGAVVCVEVKPVEEDAGTRKGRVWVVDGRKGGDNSKVGKHLKNAKDKLWDTDRNAWEVVVTDEKESLTTLGREELLDDRVSKMSVLSRAMNELDALPDDLKTPVGIADNLLNLKTKDVYGAYGQTAVLDGIDRQSSSDSIAEDSHPNAESGVGNSERQQGTQAPEPPETPRPNLTLQGSAGGGFPFNILPSYPYPNPFSRFSTSGMAINLTTAETGSSDSSGGNIGGKGGGKAAAMRLKPRKTSSSVERSTVVNPTRLYPVSTLMIIALIAFLIGSLFRSLLSPADFVYVVGDLGEAEEAQLGSGTGWREMRRLLEIKYVFGGWDFQVAVVKRH